MSQWRLEVRGGAARPRLPHPAASAVQAGAEQPTCLLRVVVREQPAWEGRRRSERAKVVAGGAGGSGGGSGGGSQGFTRVACRHAPTCRLTCATLAAPLGAWRGCSQQGLSPRKAGSTTRSIGVVSWRSHRPVAIADECRARGARIHMQGARHVPLAQTPRTLELQASRPAPQTRIRLPASIRRPAPPLPQPAASGRYARVDGLCGHPAAPQQGCSPAAAPHHGPGSQSRR